MSKKLLVNKPSNIIDDYKKWFQIYELSGAFNTIEDSRIDEEGRIYIDEIWGNTIDEKNLFDGELRQGSISSSDGSVISSNTTISSVNFIHVNGAKSLYVYREKVKGSFAFRCYDADEKYLGPVGPDNGHNTFSFNLKDGTVYVKFIDLTNDLTNKYTIATEYVNEYIPYHKPDLSNIQHAGELYVDKDGKPKLDEHGNKQYKIEIENCNSINYYPDYVLDLKHFSRIENANNITTDGEFIEYTANGNWTGLTTHNIKLEKNVYYTILIEIVENTLDVKEFQVIGYQMPFIPKGTETGIFISHPIRTNGSDIEYQSYAFKITNNNTSGKVKFRIAIYRGKENQFIEDVKQTKQTILLPCQLMKVGDVKDRLYWDVDEGKYMIEKKVMNHKDLKKSKLIWKDSSDTHYNFTFKSSISIKSDYCVYNKLKHDGCIWGAYKQEGIRIYNNEIIVCLEKNKIRNNDDQTLIDYFNTLDIYVQYETPEIIETDITERIELPCYNPTTYIVVDSGNVEPSNVKALFPMKGIDWEYDKKSGTPVSIRTLCSEYCIENDINLNIISDNQMLEMDLYEVKCVNNDPQIMLLCGENTGGKVYWDHDVLKVANDKKFILNLKTPCRLTVRLKKDNFSLYIDGALKASGSVYTSIWFKYTGIQCMHNNRDLIVTGFRYKNFNRGE